MNEFNRRCDRVRMANIAQTVNVLQAMILTEGAHMVLTPTYHVFEMYKVHQGASLLESELSCKDYTTADTKRPSMNISASKAPDGTIHITICHLDPGAPAELECVIEGITAETVSGRVLTAEAINSHNTFDRPDAVRPKSMADVKLVGKTIGVTLPPKSVAVLSVR